MAVKILLAEDDLDDKTLFFEFLDHRPDIELLPAVENGEELMQSINETLYKEQLPGIILLDQNMPKLNGLQTLEALKNSKRFSYIPVVIYSTYTDAHLVTTALARGAAKVVNKPLSKEGYDEMIDDFLRTIPPGTMPS